MSDSATTWTVALQTPLSTGFSRQEYWSGLPFPSPGDLPNPGIEATSLMSPALQVDSLPFEPPVRPCSPMGPCKCLSGRQLTRQARFSDTVALCDSVNQTQASSPFLSSVPSPEPLACGRVRNRLSKAEERASSPPTGLAHLARIPRGTKSRVVLFAIWTEHPECLIKLLYLTALVGFVIEQ